MRIVSIIVIILLVAPFQGLADVSGQQSPAGKYSKDELSQMLAPIALYPDSLLSQVLMASTYPLEVVEADRWVKQNSSLSGDKLDKELNNKTWDASVKALCYYPQPLAMLSEKLEWTTKLGDAFLSQQADVMDSVQELRASARAAGNLQTTSQQKVVVEEKYIKIEPANPTVVYVPAYNPAVVYGPWLYPAYPPYPYYYPGAVVAGAAISFGVGFAVGAAVAGWSGFNWGYHNVNINIYHGGGGPHGWGPHHGGPPPPHGNTWQHNPGHRQGVAYKDKSTAQKYGQSPSRSQQGRRDARGYGQAQGRQGQASSAKGGGYQSAGKQAQSQKSSMSQRSASQRGNAFSGSGSRQSVKAASNRGSYSRFSGSSRSGGFRSGGSRGGGHFRR